MCDPRVQVQLTYIAAISLNLQIICKGEEVNIGLRQNLEVARSPCEAGDELDGLGSGIPELEEGR